MTQPADSVDVTNVRTWALDRAINEVGNNTPWELVFGLAAKYEKYILTGEWDTPVADAKKAETEATTTEAPAEEETGDGAHSYRPAPSRPTRCLLCAKTYGEGNHK